MISWSRLIQQKIFRSQFASYLRLEGHRLMIFFHFNSCSNIFAEGLGVGLVGMHSCSFHHSLMALGRYCRSWDYFNPMYIIPMFHFVSKNLWSLLLYHYSQCMPRILRQICAQSSFQCLIFTVPFQCINKVHNNPKYHNKIMDRKHEKFLMPLECMWLRTGST